MKNISASALIIAIAMMGAVSYNAAADNHGRGPGNGRIESNHGHNPGPAAIHRPAPRPRPIAVHHRAPRPVVYHNYPARYYRRAARRAAAAMATAAAIEATRYAIGAIVSALPPYYTEVIIDGIPYYLSGNVLYRPIAANGVPCFEVVDNNYIY